MFGLYLLSEHFVVCGACHFEEYLKDPPDIRLYSFSPDRKFVCDLPEDIEESNRINEESPVDSIDLVYTDALVVQGNPVDLVSAQRVLVLWPPHYSGDIQLLSILQNIVQPLLNVPHLDTVFVGDTQGLLFLLLQPFSCCHGDWLVGLKKLAARNEGIGYIGEGAWGEPSLRALNPFLLDLLFLSFFEVILFYLVFPK